MSGQKEVLTHTWLGKYKSNCSKTLDFLDVLPPSPRSTSAMTRPSTIKNTVKSLRDG